MGNEKREGEADTPFHTIGREEGQPAKNLFILPTWKKISPPTWKIPQ